jgi:hypothetical protein
VSTWSTPKLHVHIVFSHGTLGDLPRRWEKTQRISHENIWGVIGHWEKTRTMSHEYEIINTPSHQEGHSLSHKFYHKSTQTSTWKGAW